MDSAPDASPAADTAGRTGAVPPAGDRRRLWTLSAIAVLLATMLGLYLFGPMWPGRLGRMQIATQEAWGWAGPAELNLEVVPPMAWIEVRGPALPGGLRGRGRLRAKIGAGVYHCVVRLDGYQSQAFDLRCPPDTTVTRHLQLERGR